MEEREKILEEFFKGKWVDCDLICEALQITFQEGMRYFDFGRTASWNKEPKQGQTIVTKFKLKQSKEKWS